MRLFHCILLVALTLSSLAAPACLQAQSAPSSNADIFRRDNLMAWCIVPFDAKKRGPEERAAMLAKLGFKHFAYDYRGEHVSTFDAEIEALKKHGVSLDAWWFPGSLNNEAKYILAVCKKHGVTPQLWVTGGGGPTNTPEEHAARVKQEAARIRPIAEAAAAQGMKIGLYNHGGWFGEPENQLAIIAELKLPNVGIVYNQHHGHHQLDRFAEFLPKIIPHLLVLNLNGMNAAGDQRGQKIMQLGQGELDLRLLKIIRASDYRGPIGILGHTQDDAEARLADNLDGLNWLLPQLDGKPARAKPKMRTPVPGAHDPAKPQAGGGGGGFLAEGKKEYRTLPLSVEIRATLKGKGSYNILVANDTKRSAEHWELFTMPGTGTLAVYVPGRSPDHIHTKVDICDGKPHEIAFLYETDRGRLFVDGAPAGEQKLAIKPRGGDVAPEKLAFLRLVEGGMGCDGTLDYVRLSRGLREVGAKPAGDVKADDATVGLWRFAADGKTDAADASKLANPAVRQTQAAAAPSKSPLPTAGVHLKPIDPALKVTLIDRSPDEVYMGVKADKDGNVFVGGREGVFVFERDAKAGGFKPRRELLRFPKHSIIMGLEFKDDDLFVLTCNALYLVPRGRVAREGLVPERLLWGIPLDLHVSFHCLAWGPEGDLYITHGDPLLNYGDWTRPDHWGHWVYYSRGQGSGVGGQTETQKSEGKTQNDKQEVAWRKTPYTGQGAVLRYSLNDGAVNVVATGLRGPVGLAFDDHWNMFTNDNDHESRADQYAPAKLLHVVEGIDFGWPRGWMASKSPERFDLVEPVCDLGRGVPCDLAFYDRDYLPESVQGRLLHARWDRYSVNGYKMAPRGISFSAKEETILQGDDNCRPVGIAVGPGGELFVTALYMTGNMAAPYCASDLMIVTRGDDPPRIPQGSAPLKTFTMSRDKDSLAESLWKAAGADGYGNDYDRQLAASKLGRKLSIDQFSGVQTESDDARRLAGVLAIGRKLTVPAHDETPPESLPLNYPKGNGWFHRDQVFYGSDKIVDLADFARIGSYTMAERWKAVPHTAEQEQLFGLLVKALDDPSERIRLQAAYFLGLLRDPRSEPKIEAVRRTIAIAKLQAAPTVIVREAWCMGPFASQLQQKASTATDAAPESGSIDLTTKYRNQAWEKRGADRVLLRAGSAEPDAEAPWLYVYFSVQSRVKQQGLVSVAASLERRLWVNGREIASGNDAGRRDGEIVELQPGGNELLLKFQVTSQQAGRGFDTGIRIQATDPIQLTLADRFDSSLLSARLRDAAAAGGAQPIAKEFLSVDWTKETTLGDAAAGRKLFGTLACTKCHAITADQKSAGAPSLLGAKLRFTVPHLVESVLLPSRQVAEPFRAQTFTTTAGQTFSGLVVGETAEMVELVLPDATRKTLAVKEIEERTPTTLSPMPQGLVKTPQELRDLLAYLLSEKPTPP